VRRIAQLDADCGIEPCRAAAKASDLHVDTATPNAANMALVANYFKLKCLILKLLL